LDLTDLQEYFREKPVLVTGAAGFIGSHLVRRLHEMGARVFALDRKAGEMHPGVQWIEADVLHLGADDLQGVQADVIFHLAAVLGVRYTASHPMETVAVNVAGTARVVNRTRDLGANRFCLLSSSEVYGEPDSVPIREEDPLRPLSVYGWSKVCAEEILEAHTRSGLCGVAIRPFNVYGPAQRDEFVVSRFIKLAKQGHPLTLVGDGTQRRVFTYVDDLVSGMLLAVQKQNGGYRVYNIAGEGDLSIAELANLIGRLNGLQVQPTNVPLSVLGRSETAEVNMRIPCTERAQRELGYRPQVGLEEGLRRTLGPAGDP
jgi:UDP-glucose 4-epimerase